MSRALFAVVLLAAAGCLGPANPAPDGSHLASTATPIDDGDVVDHVSVTSKTHIEADAAYLGVDPGVRKAGIQGLVPSNATFILAEVRWSGELTDFDLVVLSPKHCPERDVPGPAATDLVCLAALMTLRQAEGAFATSRAPGEIGPGQLRLGIDESGIQATSCGGARCEWSAIAYWEVAMDADVDVALTYFLDEVPDGFTALTT